MQHAGAFIATALVVGRLLANSSDKGNAAAAVQLEGVVAEVLKQLTPAAAPVSRLILRLLLDEQVRAHPSTVSTAALQDTCRPLMCGMCKVGRLV